MFVSGPNRETLVRIGRALVDDRLAACVNILPELTSVYRWEGAVSVAGEALAMVKTTRGLVDSVSRRVVELHPYDVPECIALDIVGGSQPYLSWLQESVQEVLP